MMFFSKKMKRTAVCVLAALMIAVVSHAFAAYADGAACSVSISPKTPSGEAASGGRVALYRVDGTEGDADARRLAQYAEENELFDFSAAIGEDGAARFNNLADGIWLVVQTECSDGCAPFVPFLLELPLKSEGGIIRDVVAEPKLSLPKDPDVTKPGENVEKLPHTGQLRWPIPILAAVGILMILASVFTAKRKRCE